MYVNSRSGNRVTGTKDENFNARKEERGEERQNTIERNRDQDGKNKVNDRNYQTNRNKTSGKDEVLERSYREQPARGWKKKNPEKRDRVCQRGTERDHKGRREDKTDGTWVISRKEERTRDAFPSSRKQENSVNHEKHVKDFERKDRSFQPRGQRRVNYKDKDTRRMEGTVEDKTDCKPLTPPSSGMVEGRQVNISVSTESRRCDISSKSVQTKISDHPCRSGGGDGVQNDSKIPHKNFKKRSPRKPRQDLKNSPKASETHPSRDSNYSSAGTNKTRETVDRNERKLPQNPTREKRPSQVRDNHPPLRRPPPGFEAIPPPPGLEGVAQKNKTSLYKSDQQK